LAAENGRPDLVYPIWSAKSAMIAHAFTNSITPSSRKTAAANAGDRMNASRNLKTQEFCMRVSEGGVAVEYAIVSPRNGHVVGCGGAERGSG